MEKLIPARLAPSLVCAAVIAGQSSAHALQAPVPDAPVRTPGEQERIDPNFGPAPDPVTVFRSSPGQTIPGAENQRFILRDVEVEGDTTAMSRPEILSRFAPYIGKEVSVADMLRIAQCIEGGPPGVERDRSQCDAPGLRDRGYITSRVIIPAQEVSNGVFRIRIVEGYVANVCVEPCGAEPAEDARGIGPAALAVEAFADRASKSRPVSKAALERALLLANDQPGISARASLSRSNDEGALGASDLAITAERDPFEFFIVADNRGSEFTGPWAGFAGFALNSHTRYAERLEGVVYSTFDFDEQFVGQIAYSQLAPVPALGARGMRIGFSVSNSTTQPGEDLALADFDSDTIFASVFATYPFVRSEAWSLEGRVAANYTDTKTKTGGALFSRDNIRTLTAGLLWRNADNFGLAEAAGRANATTFEVTFKQGFSVFNASSEADFPKSRADAGGTFAVVSGDVSRRQLLPVSLPGFAGGETKSGIPTYLSVRAAGQWASEPLFAVEEFQLGGSRFGRGYEPAELAGDHALAVTAELQADLMGQIGGVKTPRTISELGDSLRATDGGAASPFFDAAQLYVFYDYGSVWNMDSTSFGTRESLSSAGGGVRLRFLDHFGVDVEGAKPLTRYTRQDLDRNWAAFVRLVVY